MKGKKIDYAGEKIGNLTVLSFVMRRNGRSYWNCKCDCGHEFVGEVHNLKYHIEKHGQNRCKKCRMIKHGDAVHTGKKLRLYNIWQGMIARCEKPYANGFSHYGGCGIRVCDEWHDYAVFRKWSFLNGYNDTLTIDRINGNGNYEPSNCRWATRKEQARNTSQVLKLSYKGETIGTDAISALAGVSTDLVRARIARGWTMERIVETPHRTIAKRKNAYTNS